MGVEKNTWARSIAIYQMLEDVLICSSKASTSYTVAEIKFTLVSPLLAITFPLIVGGTQMNWMEIQWRLALLPAITSMAISAFSPGAHFSFYLLSWPRWSGWNFRGSHLALPCNNDWEHYEGTGCFFKAFKAINKSQPAQQSLTITIAPLLFTCDHCYITSASGRNPYL